MNMFTILPSLAITIAIIAILFRRRRKIHIPMMLSAFTIDFGVLLAIELGRGAVETAVSKSLPGILILHIAVSTSLVLVYFFMMFSGYRLLTANIGRYRHRVGALCYIGFRMCNYVTAFMIPVTVS